MNPRTAVAGGLVLGLLLAGCTPVATTIKSTGRVQSDTVTAQAPTLIVPRLNLNGGFVVTPTTTANLSWVPMLLGFGSAARVVSVEARIGDQVAIQESLAGDDYLEIFRSYVGLEGTGVGYEVLDLDQATAPAFDGLLDLTWAQPIEG